jgi:hypothetical protein
VSSLHKENKINAHWRGCSCLTVHNSNQGISMRIYSAGTHYKVKNIFFSSSSKFYNRDTVFVSYITTYKRIVITTPCRISHTTAMGKTWGQQDHDPAIHKERVLSQSSLRAGALKTQLQSLEKMDCQLSSDRNSMPVFESKFFGTLM